MPARRLYVASRFMRIEPAAILRATVRAANLGLLATCMALLAVPAWRQGPLHAVCVGLFYATCSVDVWRSWRQGDLRKTLPDIYAEARAGRSLGSRDPLERIAFPLAVGTLAYLFFIG
jgi:hypothetical protein